MAKVFSFTSVLRKNMMEKDKPDLYYALAKSSGEIDIDEMAERIQRSSTVNWADVVCVLRALQTEMIDSLRKERSSAWGISVRFMSLCAATAYSSRRT